MNFKKELCENILPFWLKNSIDKENGFVSLLVLSGEITVKYYGDVVVAQKGASILIPENLKALLIGKAEVICSKAN